MFKIFQGENMYIVNESHKLGLTVIEDYNIEWNDEYNGWCCKWLEYIDEEAIPIHRGKYFLIREENKEDIYQDAIKYMDTMKKNKTFFHKSQTVPITVADYLNLDKETKELLVGLRIDENKRLIKEDIQVKYYQKDKFYGFDVDGNHKFIIEHGIITYNSNGDILPFKVV